MVVVPVWALAFEMRYAPSVREAAVAFDMAAAADLVSLAEYDELVTQLSGWTGIPRMRDARQLLCENSWSPWEARMSHLWQLDAGLDRPLANVPLFDRFGRHLLTPDLFDPVAGLAGEYNGVVHASPEQRRRDRDRAELYGQHRIEVVVFMAGDTTRRSVAAARILSARARARFEQEPSRTWTLERPSWWSSTDTVAQRRALTEVERTRLLRHRAA